MSEREQMRAVIKRLADALEDRLSMTGKVLPSVAFGAISDARDILAMTAPPSPLRARGGFRAVS